MGRYEMDSSDCDSLDGRSSSPTTSLSGSELSARVHLLGLLRRLWSEILGEEMDDIDDGDSFFDLGGNSLSAADLTQQAKKHGIQLTMEVIFEYSVLDEMATHATLTSSTSEEKADSESVTVPFSLMSGAIQSPDALQSVRSTLARKAGVHGDQIEDIYPCSPVQEAVMSASVNGRHGYMTQRVYRLEPYLDITRFQECWESAFGSIAALSTRIARCPPYGMLQYVVRSDVLQWQRGENMNLNLDGYLHKDKEDPMTEGSALFRIALVRSNVDSDSGPRPLYLVVTLHHAIFDAVALAHIMQDVLSMYKNEKQLANVVRPSFSHFIWHLQHGLDLQAAEAFWSSQIQHIHPAQFPLKPGDWNEEDSVPRASTSATWTTDFRWPQAQKPGLTPALLIRAAWAIVLARHSHHDDVSFAVTLNGRTAAHGKYREAIGPTVTTVPMCVRVNAEASVADFLDGIRRQATGMIPFEQYGILNVRRRLKDGIRASSVSSLLVVQSSSESDIDGLLIPIGVVPVNAGIPLCYDFPLVNECTPTPTGYQLALRYDDRILSEAFVHVLAAHFQRVLLHLCQGSNAQSRIGQIDCFSSADQAALRKWNDQKGSHLPADETVPSLLQRRAAAFPDAPAICAWDGSFTYQQLDFLSSRLCRRLLEDGVTPGMLVPICSEKSKWVPVAILAVMKTCAAWVPLDPQHPVGRIEEILQLARATISLCSRRQASLLAGKCPRLTVTEDVCENESNDYEEALLPERDPRKIVRVVSPSSRAYVFFTSGSTGKPKGVVISHGALSAAVLAHGIELECNSTWRCLQFSAYSFDVSNCEIFMTLCHGGCVCIPSDDQCLNDLPGAIRDLDVNTACLTPSVAQLFLPEELPSLSTLIFTGEASNTEHIARWADHVRLCNAYGPTESTIYCAIRKRLTPTTDPLDIGHACGGTAWVVALGNHERLAAVGEMGELAISGPIVGDGYLANEEATQASFVTASWLSILQPSSTASPRLYLTGDLAFHRPDGSLQLMGRRDHQIKLHGYRIELGEIERRLAELAPKAQIVVAAPKAGHCQKHVCALFCFEDTMAPLSTPRLLPKSKRLAQIGQRLAQQVPHYMVPSYWGLVDQFPLSPAGKLDRKRVSTWLDGFTQVDSHQLASQVQGSEDGSARIDDHHDHAGSLSDDETVIFEKIRGVWSQVLQIEKSHISPSSEFLSVHGDSLAAIRVVAQCRKIGVHITVQDLLLHQNLASLCRLIAPSSASVSDPKRLPADSSIIPVSETQKHWLSLPTHGRRGFALRLLIDVPQGRLQAAFDSLFDVHYMLRVHNVVRSEATDTDTSSSSTTAIEQHWSTKGGAYRLRFHQHRCLVQEECARIVQDAHNSINLAEGPVFSVDVYRCAAGPSVIYMASHEAVLDDVSWLIIRHHVDHFLARRRAPAAPEIGFRDWIQSHHRTSSRRLDDAFFPVQSPRQEEDSSRLVSVSANERDVTEIRRDVKWTELVRSIPAGLLVPGFEAQHRIAASIICAFNRVFPDVSWPRVVVRHNARGSAANPNRWQNVIGQFSMQSPVYQTSNIGGFKAATEAMANIVVGPSARSPDYWPTAHPHPSSSLPEIFFCYRFARTGAQSQKEAFGFVEQIAPVPEGPSETPGGLFHIDINLTKAGLLYYGLTFDAQIYKPDLIARWADEARDILITSFSDTLSVAPDEEDLPRPSYPAVSTPMTEEVLHPDLLQRLGGPKNIEDIYPCSHMQSSILQHQRTDPSLFRVEFKMHASLPSGVNLLRLQEAWQVVVGRHTILRTVFVTPEGSQTPIQIVLKTVTAAVELPPKKSVERGSTVGPSHNDDGRSHPPHRLVLLLLVSGDVECILQISHALVDGYTVRILQHDLSYSYSKNEFPAPAPTYRRFIDDYMETSLPQQLAYWKHRLRDPVPCLLSASPPRIPKQPDRVVSLLTLPVTSASCFTPFCRGCGNTIATIIDAAWALTLGEITGMKVPPTFGHIISGRHVPVPRLTEIAGPTIAVVTNQIPIPDRLDKAGLEKLCGELQEARFESLKYTGCSPLQVQRELASSQPLFDTAVNVLTDQQMTAGSGPRSDKHLNVKTVDVHDPWDVDILVRVSMHGQDVHSRLEYKSARFDHEYVQAIAGRFWEKVQMFM